MTPLRLGTRGSPLALWQARHVAELLRPIVDPQPVELVLIETIGDRVQDKPLSAMGGFGVFTKAIQQALLDDRADVAVHSLKDLPTEPTEGTELVATPPRGPTGDALVSHKHRRFDDLPRGATVGTSSLRRRAQLLNRRPDLKLIDLRGNVDTRLRKLVDQDFDAIILAEAGLVRLGLADRLTEVLDADWMLPAVGQGAIGLECRTADAAPRLLVEGANDWATCRAAAPRRRRERLGDVAARDGGARDAVGARRRVPRADWRYLASRRRRADDSRSGAVPERAAPNRGDASRTGGRAARDRAGTRGDAVGRGCEGDSEPNTITV